MARRLEWRHTARGRSTLAATGVVAISLIVAGVLAVAIQHKVLIDTVDSALTARVDDLNALILDGKVPTMLAVPGDDDALVQIVDADGAVIATSENIEGQGRITDLEPLPNQQVVAERRLPIGDDEFRLVARNVVAGDQSFTIYAASNLDQVTEAVNALGFILLIGIPILIGLVATTVWIIIGRTLNPVEAIRAEVASIGDRQLDRRVPVPSNDDEIGRLAGTMNEMLDRLEQASNQQRRFVANASHELRSPLAAIRSQLEVDLIHPDQADWLTANAEVLEETIRMQRLVDDLLLLARSDTGTIPNVRKPVDLDDVLFAQVDRLTPTGLTIDTSRVSGAQVTGDPAALSRVVGNLLENASRYATSRIDLALTEANGSVLLTIDDDGPGIPAAARTKVLDRFTRLDEARDRDHGGAGLGLAIAKEIIEYHRGTITIDDSPLLGTRVIVTLPSAFDNDGIDQRRSGYVAP